MSKEIKETKKISEVKHVSDIIGEWGNWQRNFFIYLFIVDIIVAFSKMGYSFSAFEVELWYEDVPKDYKVYIFIFWIWQFYFSEQKQSNQVFHIFKATILFFRIKQIKWSASNSVIQVRNAQNGFMTSQFESTIITEVSILN